MSPGDWLIDVTEWTDPCNQSTSNSPCILGDAQVLEDSGGIFFLEKNY